MNENITAAEMRTIRKRLTELALRWESLKEDIDEIEAEMEHYILYTGETYNASNVTMRFFNGRRQLDYETPGSMAAQELIDANSEVHEYTDWEEIAKRLEPSEALITEFTDSEKSVNWTAVCKAAGIEPIVMSQADPYVKIELLKD